MIGSPPRDWVSILASEGVLKRTFYDKRKGEENAKGKMGKLPRICSELDEAELADD
jgi:hypothetical protein